MAVKFYFTLWCSRLNCVIIALQTTGRTVAMFLLIFYTCKLDFLFLCTLLFFIIISHCHSLSVWKMDLSHQLPARENNQLCLFSIQKRTLIKCLESWQGMSQNNDVPPSACTKSMLMYSMLLQKMM